MQTNALAAIGLALMLMAAGEAAAQPTTCGWAASPGSTGLWSQSSNWTNCRGGVPRNGDSVQFGGYEVQRVARNDLFNLELVEIFVAGWTVGSLPYELQGNRVTVTGRIYAQHLYAGARIGLPITLGAPVNVVVTQKSDPNGPLYLAQIDLNGQELEIANGYDTDIGRIAGQGIVTKKGDGTVRFLGANTYEGLTQVQQGRLVVMHEAGLGASAEAFDFTLVTAGATVELAGAMTVSESFSISGTGLDGRGALRMVAPDSRTTLTGGVLLFANTSIGVAAGGQFVLSGKVSTPPSAPDRLLEKVGPGSLTLAGRGNAWGTLVVTEGILAVGAENALPVNASVGLGANALLDLGGHPAAIGPLSGQASSRVALSGTLTVNVPTGTGSTFAGVFQGAGSLVKTGGGQLILRGDQPSSYAGTTTLDAGLLLLGKAAGRNSVGTGALTVNGGLLNTAGADQIPDAVPVVLNRPGRWEVGASELVGSLAGSGDIESVYPPHSIGTLAIGANGASTTFTGSIEGHDRIRIVKTGAGTLTLTGTTDGHDTQLDGGTLVVNGSLAVEANVLILAAGTLAGTGTVGVVGGSPFAPGATGSIAPGTSPGVLTVGAELAFLPGALIVELNGPAPGTGYDQLRARDNLLLEPGATLRVTRGFTPPKGTAFTIATAGKNLTGTFAGLPEGAQLSIDGQTYQITYRGGRGHDIVLTALDEPQLPERTYFLAEGATGAFFDEDIVMANPGRAPAPVTLTFFKDTGEQVVATRTIDRQSQIVVRVDEIPGLEQSAASVRVTSTSGQELFVERTMFWDANAYAGHTGAAIDEPSADWFFAEGAQGYFDTYLLIVNPNAQEATVTVTFLREQEAPVVKTLPIGPGSRLTVGAGDYPELHARAFGIAVHATQPVMAERAMYFASLPGRLWGGGHESAGVTAPSKSWYLAEGATGAFFDTFILLSNPQSTPAQVTMRYLLDSGETIDVPKTVPANGRLTVNPEAEDDARLWSATLSTVVTADLPIVAERSMYWAAATRPWGEAHNSFGVIGPNDTWGLAEGRVGGDRLPFSTYILLANPQDRPVDVVVTFLRSRGGPIERTFTVPATGRFTIDASTIDELRDITFGATISSNGPIVVERSMYWNAGGIVWSGGTNATGIPRI